MTATRVLVTGSEGYIGSVLMPELLQSGFLATGLDTGWFADGALTSKNRSWQVVHKDIRDLELDDLVGYHAVIHLAALCNDPLGEIDPELTLDINYRATVRLGELARRAGVSRFVFSSSCSMYGLADSDELDENAAFNPQTAYARSKVLAETELNQLATDSFSPISLRNATAYGVSPRQRFDLVVPNLVGWAYTSAEIKMSSDGSPWRPLVHIRDISAAMLASVQAPREAVHCQAFNIGVAGENYRIREVARAIEAVMPGSRVSFGPSQHNGDTRSYRVSFNKAQYNLPGFRPTWTLRHGIEECLETFRKIPLDRSIFEDRRYTRLKQIRYLLDSGAIDCKLRWRKEPSK